MNPYEILPSKSKPSQRRSLKTHALSAASAAIFGVISGVCVWLSLFIFVGFNSEFSIRLTTMFGRDFTAANYDWMIFAAMIVPASMIAFSIGGLLASCIGRLPTRIPIRLTFLVVPSGLLALFVYSLCQSIDADFIRPLVCTAATAFGCAAVFSSPMVGLIMNAITAEIGEPADS